ncbi:LuxR C-terminal-related transcriptional regulator [Bacteroides reticulotermitis]|uniref:DNA-binding response regulator n=2 Tax=Bacteroides reticulotermitis TaxID=1133319 RepID=W4V114_9BACE|nr:response regulator transcription factor [Bacteroides reticulotermitis]MBB4043679.1 DNA-binding NarL/FixJ family response regulator [Bacteroides reticulotermitis]GAE86419.1 DNA-binding response regulator [Bacteroides reticulotermitis JCM 10512]
MDTKFIIADNQDITSAGLHKYIGQMFGSCSITDVTTKKELVSLLMQCNDAVVVLDYTLFDLSGVEELLVIERRFPKVRWVLFSNELSESIIRRLGIEPFFGMVLKESTGEEIRSALKCASRGERFLCHQITNLLLIGSGKPEISSVLTSTEAEILRLIASGKTVKEIAALRISSVHTIITHKKNIFRKLEVNNVYEATKYALRAGLVEMVEYYI